MKDYTVILSRDPESGVYTALCPAMPGAVAEASSRSEALDALAGVMQGWLEIGAEEGFAPRPETPELVAAVLRETLEDRAAEGWDLAVETASLAPAVSTAA